MALAGAEHQATFHTATDEDGRTSVVLTGSWTLRGIGRQAPALTEALRPYVEQAPHVAWDCEAVEALDNVGALLLWRLHGFTRPDHVRIREEHRALFRHWSERVTPPTRETRRRPTLLSVAARAGKDLVSHALGFTELVGQVVLDVIGLVRAPAQIPWIEISGTLYEAGVRALGITALVGILVGVVMSYLSALELRTFGAPSFIVNILGISILRELGPLLAAILVAGRSGSAMAAELGVMRITEELDALSAMGVSRTVRLVIPKILALTIGLPLLVIWTDAIALVAGMVTAHIALGISIPGFIHAIPSAVPLINLVLGIVKGAVFGTVIALVACHFGLRILPNTQSLGAETTNAVVTAITAVIFVDAIFAVVFRSQGLP